MLSNIMKMSVAFLSAFMASNLAAAQNPPVVSGEVKETGNQAYDEAVSRFLSDQRPKVIGGTPAAPGTYLWQASLQISWIASPESSHYCGGAVISDRMILTAAHCTANLTPLGINVVAGANRLIPGVFRINVSRIIYNWNFPYNPDTHENDIAIIETVSPLPLGQTIKAISILEPQNEDLLVKEGTPSWTSGWGATVENGTNVSILQELSIPIVSRENCSDLLSYGNAIKDHMICAGDLGKDTCQGDSGGALVVRDKNNTPSLVGVTSWGEGCAQPGKYGVYTRATVFYSWLKSCIQGSQACN